MPLKKVYGYINFFLNENIFRSCKLLLDDIVEILMNPNWN